MDANYQLRQDYVKGLITWDEYKHLICERARLEREQSKKQEQKAIDLNPNTDQLAILEGKIRADGAWCRVWGKFDMRHKMICKRDKSSIAISRCGQVIVPFAKLQEDSVVKKCLVCSMYDEGGEEEKLASEKTLARLVDEIETKP